MATESRISAKISPALAGVPEDLAAGRDLWMVRRSWVIVLRERVDDHLNKLDKWSASVVTIVTLAFLRRKSVVGWL
ncbi:MAG: hypothetical protein WBB07_05280 [Mycobacterium sp.]